MLTVDQVVSAQKTQFATLFGLSARALESMEQLTKLNLQATKAALEESASHAQSLVTAKDVPSLLALQSAAMQPLAEKAAAYSRHLYDIASGLGMHYGEQAEIQAREVQKQFLSSVDGAMKNAPQGSESAVAAIKNAMTTATAAMESVQKTVQQATELAETNFQAMTRVAPVTGTTKTGKGSKASA